MNDGRRHVGPPRPSGAGPDIDPSRSTERGHAPPGAAPPVVITRPMAAHPGPIGVGVGVGGGAPAASIGIPSTLESPGGVVLRASADTRIERSGHPGHPGQARAASALDVGATLQSASGAFDDIDSTMPDDAAQANAIREATRLAEERMAAASRPFGPPTLQSPNPTGRPSAPPLSVVETNVVDAVLPSAAYQRPSDPGSMPATSPTADGLVRPGPPPLPHGHAWGGGPAWGGAPSPGPMPAAPVARVAGVAPTAPLAPPLGARASAPGPYFPHGAPGPHGAHGSQGWGGPTPGAAIPALRPVPAVSTRPGRAMPVMVVAILVVVAGVAAGAGAVVYLRSSDAHRPGVGERP